MGLVHRVARSCFVGVGFWVPLCRWNSEYVFVVRRPSWDCPSVARSCFVRVSLWAYVLEYYNNSVEIINDCKEPRKDKY